MVSEPTPVAEFSGGAATTLTVTLLLLPSLQWTVNAVEPVLSQSPESLVLLPMVTTFTVPGGAGVTPVDVVPVGQFGRVRAVSTPSGTEGSWPSTAGPAGCA